LLYFSTGECCANGKININLKMANTLCCGCSGWVVNITENMSFALDIRMIFGLLKELIKGSVVGTNGNFGKFAENMIILGRQECMEADKLHGVTETYMWIPFAMVETVQRHN